MANRYRTGTRLHDGKIPVRGVTKDVNGNIIDRGLRIKYDNHTIDLDKLRVKYNWSDADFEQAVRKMDYLVENTPRGGGRGFYRDEPVTSAVVAAAESQQAQNCIAFWAEGDKQRTCDERAEEGSLYCTKHAPKPEGAGVDKTPVAAGSKKGK